jgi:hypothetical protein
VLNGNVDLMLEAFIYLHHKKNIYIYIYIYNNILLFRRGLYTVTQILVVYILAPRDATFSFIKLFN